jgi:hypothetical protein
LAFDFGLRAALCAAFSFCSSADCRWIAVQTLSFTSFQSANCSSALAISTNFIADFPPRIYATRRSQRGGGMSIAFRHTAGFGKRIEYYIIGLMLKQGLDVFMPLVDDNAIDAVIKRPDGSFIEVQIKARSNDVGLGHGGLFAAITHELRHNYWFVLYTERHDGIFIPVQRRVH